MDVIGGEKNDILSPGPTFGIIEEHVVDRIASVGLIFHVLVALVSNDLGQIFISLTWFVSVFLKEKYTELLLDWKNGLLATSSRPDNPTAPMSSFVHLRQSLFFIPSFYVSIPNFPCTCSGPNLS